MRDRNWKRIAVPCTFIACSLLSRAHTEAGGHRSQADCPCERRAAARVGVVELPPPTSVPATSLYVAPLPPVPPPPGTLGTTYIRRSWPIPANRHPRVGMLDVRAPAGATNIRVLTTYQYREEDEIEGFQDPDDPCLWHFESKPLIPGIPHVYDVVAEGPKGEDVRTVRLIRGRRVTLEF